MYNTNLNDLHTVKPPIRGQPPYNGQTACPLPLHVGDEHFVHCSEVEMYEYKLE